MGNKIFFVCFVMLSSFQIHAQLSPQNIPIPMRDGQTLAGHLYLPNDTDSFPVILIQTPYNKALFQFAGLPLGVGYDLEDSDYAFVVLDWRCFFGSLGACTLNPNRGEDGYDAVEWIAEQPWSNGKVGTWGPSALGNVQFSTAYEQPPHLICAVPEVAAPWETYPKYYPGGSIITEQLETLQLLFDNFDIVINNPYYNLIWQIAENSTMRPEDVQIPMLLVAGWFDHNTEWDFVLIDTLAGASAEDVRDQHKILVGPWVHGGTGPANVGTEQQGDLSFPAAAQQDDFYEKQFFDYYLLDIDNGWANNERYIYFQMGDNTWQQSASWPPLEVQKQTFYLHENGNINVNLPQSDNAVLGFNYDPNDPSPTIGGKTLNLELLQGPYDQSNEVESRNDVLIFSTPTLSEDLSLAGKINVNLYVSSDQPDTDFALRLTEVYPDGRSILLGESIQRMRFRHGFRQADEAFMTSGEVYPISLEFEPLANTFKTGNQLRLIISSSNYPRYNRNMNTGGEMYPNSNIDTLVNPQVAMNKVYLNSVYPSNIELPLLGVVDAVAEVEESQVWVYPNPAVDWIFVEGNDLEEVALYDVDGRLVKVIDTPSGWKQINISELASGLYWLRVRADGRSVVRKMIKL